MKKKILIGAGCALALAAALGVWVFCAVLHTSRGLRDKYLAFTCEAESFPKAYGYIEELSTRGKKYAASQDSIDDWNRLTKEMLREFDAFGFTPEEKSELAAMNEHKGGFFILRIQRAADGRCPERAGKGDGKKAGRFLAESASALGLIQHALEEAGTRVALSG